MFVGTAAGNTNVTGNNNTIVGNSADVTSGNLTYATAIGADAVASQSNSIFLGRSNGSDSVRIAGSTVIDGTLVIGAPGGAGSTSVCLNAANRITFPCSSSLRYKTNINRFGFGLDLVTRLSPITFDWKDGGMHDLGLGAEDVEAIEPLLVTYNAKGEVEGVKYDRIGVVLVNAVKEQQKMIEKQQLQIDLQVKQIAEMKALICAGNRLVNFCKKP